MSRSGRCALACGQHVQSLRIAGARVAHGMREAAHRLEVLREHVDPAIDHGLDVRAHALEIRCQRLDGGRGIALFDGADGRGVVGRAAVRKIVAVHGGEHDVAQPHQLHRTRNVRGLLRIEPTTRVAGVDGAEPAGTSADRAHQHDGGGAGVPAFADIGAFRLLAHRAQPMFADDAPDGRKGGTARHGRPQPTRLAGGGRVAGHVRVPAGFPGSIPDPILDGGEALRSDVFFAAAH